MTMSSSTDPIVLWAAISTGASVTAYGCATRLPQRVGSLALLAIASVLFALAPHLASVCESVLLVQSLTCLLGSSAFKVTALAIRRGVLARELAAGCGLWRFCGACILPVIPTNTGQPASGPCTGAVIGKLQQSAVKLCAFAMLTLAGMWMLYDGPTSSQAWTWLLPLLKPFLFYLSGLALWLEVDGMGDLVDALALALFGISAAPHFRTPVMATTVAEYWGKRWNLTMSAMLKDLVFDPFIEGRLLPEPAHHSRHPSGSCNGSDSSPSHAQTPVDAAAGQAGGVGCKGAAHSAAALEPAGPIDEPLETPALACVPGASANGQSPVASANGAQTARAAHALAAPRNGSGAMHSSGSGSTLSSSDSGSSAGMFGSVCRSDSQGSMAAGGSPHAHKRAGRRPSSMRKAVASLATFAVSGIWHELVFYQMSGGFGTYGYWTAFFVLQAFVIPVESAMLKQAAKRGWQEPKWLAMLRVNLTCVLFITLFWAPPLTRQLPSSCRALPEDAPGQAAMQSVFERIMHQGHRDLQHALQQARAVTAAASGSVLGGTAVQDSMARAVQAVQAAGQLLAAPRELLGAPSAWLKEAAAKLAR